jgi:hypothetical protein
MERCVASSGVLCLLRLCRRSVALVQISARHLGQYLSHVRRRSGGTVVPRLRRSRSAAVERGVRLRSRAWWLRLAGLLASGPRNYRNNIVEFFGFTGMRAASDQLGGRPVITRHGMQPKVMAW